MASTFEIDLQPESWIPDPTSPPEFGVLQGRSYWAFDADTDEILRSRALQMPVAYAGSGTLKLDVWYIMASAVASDVRIAAAVEAITDGDAVDLDAGESFDSENTATETVPATAGYASKLTITLTNKDSVAAGDWLRIKFWRDADHGSEDDATGDLRMIGATLREEV